MKIKILILFIFLTAAVTAVAAQALKFTNGKWFNGNSFVAQTVYSVDGILKSTAPVKLDSVVDLKGKFVVPPFGEAHNHNVRKYSKFSSLSDKYLKAGIYYVKNPNCLSDTKRELIESKLINEKNTIDAVFANGGFTGKDGHPIGIVDIMIMRGVWTDAEGDGNFYNSISSKSELDKKWPNDGFC